jgi:membrane protein DedA with SNARE-associated domain
VPFAVLGIGSFCFALAGIGWAVGSSYNRVHGDLRYVDVAAVLLVVVLAVIFVRRRWRSSATGRKLERSRSVNRG